MYRIYSVQAGCCHVGIRPHSYVWKAVNINEADRNPLHWARCSIKNADWLPLNVLSWWPQLWTAAMLRWWMTVDSGWVLATVQPAECYSVRESKATWQKKHERHLVAEITSPGCLNPCFPRGGGYSCSLQTTCREPVCFGKIWSCQTRSSNKLFQYFRCRPLNFK